jgi:hypothetical protein
VTSETAPEEGAAPRFVEYSPLPAIPDVGALTPEDAKAARWTLALVWFMRTISVVWIAKGLFDWTILLGADPATPNVLELPGPMAAMVCFFAVADLVAAVGLWLAAPWGGVLWLLCAATEAAGPVLGARASMANGLAVILDFTLIIVYFGLNFMAAQERS